MRGAMKRPFTVAILFALTILATAEPTHLAASPDALGKLDTMLRARAGAAHGHSRVIVRTKLSLPLADLVVRGVGGSLLRRIPSIACQVVVVPNAALRRLAANPLVEHVALDRVIVGAMERTGQAVGAAAARQDFGYDGAGVGVAIIDSGVTAWHDDLSQGGSGQRVARFVDFANGATDAARRLRSRYARRRHHRRAMASTRTAREPASRREPI